MTPISLWDRAETADVHDDRDLDLRQFGRTPVVIRNASVSWPALERWSDQYLSATIGHVRVPALVSDNGMFGAKAHRSSTLSFDEYLRESQRSGSATWCAQQLRMMRDTDLALLFDDIVIPRCIPRGALRAVNLWHTNQESTTRLHFDLADNLLVQIDGHKRLLLVAPAQGEKLYAHPISGEVPPHMSQLVASSVDLERFPKTAGASAIIAEVQRGDAVFIPGGWWHEVRSYPRCLAVNFWWSCDLPISLRMPSHIHGVLRALRRMDANSWVTRAMRYALEVV